MTTPTRYEALLMVREAFETEEAMATAFDVTQPTVWRWLNQSKQLPADKALLAERLTRVNRTWLAPDIYPPGLVDGVPYEPEEPMLEFCPLVFSRQASRDSRAADADARFHGVDRRAGAQA
jgi:DNA-binding transcriptional regulator YdaS (Cro superfamily)